MSYPILKQEDQGNDGSSSRTSAKSTARNILDSYLTILSERPIVTKSMTSAILNSIGDIVSQTVLEDKRKVDIMRLMIFMAHSSLLVAPALHFIYAYMDQCIRAQKTKAAIIKMVLDQLVLAPILLPVFLSALWALMGKASAAPAKIRQDYFELLRNNWKVWIPAQSINFYFVPVHLQVVVASCVGVLWNVFLSWISHRPVQDA